MPIYCYECNKCGTTVEKMVPMNTQGQEDCLDCKSTMVKVQSPFTNTNKKAKSSTAEIRVKEFIEDARRTLNNIKDDLQEDLE
jgi:putative FmdB family regulatory protein